MPATNHQQHVHDLIPCCMLVGCICMYTSDSRSYIWFVSTVDLASFGCCSPKGVRVSYVFKRMRLCRMRIIFYNIIRHCELRSYCTVYCMDITVLSRHVCVLCGTFRRISYNAYVYRVCFCGNERCGVVQHKGVVGGSCANTMTYLTIAWCLAGCVCACWCVLVCVCIWIGSFWASTIYVCVSGFD